MSVSWLRSNALLWTRAGAELRLHVIVLTLACLAAMNWSARAETPHPFADSGYLIHTWETADGLPENSATAMVQTSDGYLWFGTFNGLVRFDGIKFTVFNHFNTPELPDNNIVNLHLDREGRLWVSTGLGLVTRKPLSAEGGRVDWRTFTADDGWNGDLVRTFAERPNGDLLLTTFNGQVLEFSDNRFMALPPPPGEPGQGYFGGVDEAGQWWVTQNRFVGRWDGSQWISTIAPNPSLGRSAVASAVARDGALWIFLGKELVKFREGKEVLRLPLPRFSGGVWSMSEDSRANVWICSYDSGLFRVSPTGDLHHWGETNGLGYHATRFVFEDRERNLWVGTSGGGLRRYKPRRISDMTLDGPLAGRVTRSVWPSADGRMLIASPELGLFQREASGVSRVMVPGPRNETGYGLSVVEDRRGRLWYGDMDHCWWRQEPLSFERISVGLPKSANVGALFEDSQGRIWIAAGQGVVTFDDGGFRELGIAQGLPTGRVLCFAETRSRAIWLASEQGVFRYDTGRFLEVRGSDGESLRDVLCLKAEPDGTLWMGTHDRGLLRWQEGRLHRLGTAVGLPVESVNAILEDGHGYYWMTSNRGIVRAARTDLHAAANGDLRRLNCLLLTASDGLPSMECATGQPTCVRDPAGRLWFATQKGVAMVDPAKLEFNTLPPPVHIERVSFHRDNPGVEIEPADSKDKAEAAVVRLQPPFVRAPELPAGTRRLEIEYTALSYSSPERVRFQVKLDGISRDWEDAQDQRVARFYELRPGDYVFRVRAANNDGVWNETGASLAFSVLPFFWQTWWFRLVAGLLLVGLGGALAWSWSRQRIARAMERERLVHETHLLRDELTHASRVSTMGQLASGLAHELGQPLGAILRNAEAAELLMEQAPPDLEEIRAILTDIRQDDQRAAGVIDRMRSLLKRRPVERIPLAVPDLVQEVAALVRPNALQHKVQITLEVPRDLPTVCGDRIQLQQVLLNLLLNGMDAMSQQSSGTRRLIVQARKTENQMVEMSVQDSGPGIPAQSLDRVFEPFFTTKAHGMGMGLPVSKAIIEAHKGKMWAENGPTGGAVFWFTVPVAKGDGDR
ncbi:MAG: hypothetical protein KIS67_20660 [Verrucomicrobiae bacterium]|nr:hypothetical protein [Verrucomicrobiae bacterium]